MYSPGAMVPSTHSSSSHMEGNTEREAASAEKAGIVVAHPAKIQVIEIGEGKKQTDIVSKPQ